MKSKAKVKQPSPDEIINDYLKTHNPNELFVNGDVSCLTDDGKAVLAIGLTCFTAFNKLKI